MTDLDYEMIAKDVLMEMANQGRLAGATRQRVPELLQRYKAQLEDSIHRRIYNELRRLGRLWQFRQVAQDAPDQGMAFLKKAIPNYDTFLRNAVTQAKREITDSSPQ